MFLTVTDTIVSANVVGSPILIPDFIIQGALEISHYLNLAIEYIITFFKFIFGAISFVSIIIPFLPTVFVISVFATVSIFVAKALLSLLEIIL